MAGDAIGHGATVAWLKNSAAWNTLAAVAGANHGIEIDRESMKSDSQLIELMGVTGKKTQLPALKGNELTAGDVGPMDFYYDGLQRILAQACGLAGAPTTPGGATLARLHVFKMADNHKGIYGTLVEKTSAAISEWPFCKPTGYTLECQSGQALKLTVPIIASTINFNQGVFTAGNVVAPVLPANITFTLLLTTFAEPTPLRFTYTVGTGTVTEYIITVVGIDVHGDVVTYTYKKSTDGLVSDTPVYWTSIISIIATSLTGPPTGDTIQIGTTNGKNNDTSVASITYPADRNMAVFAALRIYVNDQSAAALDNTVVKGIKSVKLMLQNNLKQSVTTKNKRLTDEPLSDGFSNVEITFDFERWSTVTGDELNHDLVKAYMLKGKKKIKVEWLGPVLETVSNVTFQYRLTAWLNNVVFTAGDPNMGGPGQIPLSMTGRAFRATAIPTGFPTGYTDPCTLELVNKDTADALA